MTEVQNWPAWRYGPDGKSAIFQHEGEVPEGWEDHPSKVKGGAHPRMSPGYSEDYPATVAADHGDVVAEHGGATPATHETGGGTTGGGTGQTTDKTAFSLPPFEQVDKSWIIEQLNGRKIVHNPRWQAKKLYDLLYDAVSPAK